MGLALFFFARARFRVMLCYWNNFQPKLIPIDIVAIRTSPVTRS